MKNKIFNIIFTIAITGSIFFIAQSVSAQTINTNNQIYGETIIYVTEEEGFSNGNIGVSYIRPTANDREISPFGTSKPTGKWNLSSSGRYDFSGGASYEALYTNYLFTGASSVRVKLTATKNNSLRAELWQRKTGFLQSDSKVYTFSEVPVGNTTETTVFGLSSSASYYIKFLAPAYFTGWIEKN